MFIIFFFFIGFEKINHEIKNLDDEKKNQMKKI